MVSNPAVDAFLQVNLNPAQKEAVVAPDGPLLILAGAGSGKTRVIAYRIAYLVMERGVLPAQIMAVTFTNKAASEMKGRVEALIGAQARQAVMGTFHSICARLLRRYAPRIGYESSFSIYDDADQLAVIKRCYVEAGINLKQFAPQAVRAAISRAKEELLTPLQYARLADGPFETVAATVYRRYQDALQEQNALDFDDLLVLTLRLFEEAPDVLANLQEGFRHVLVDEYQDVNKAQYLLVRALAEKHRNLTIVGDDSQAIYGWRGANVRYILAFEEDFPETAGGAPGAELPLLQDHPGRRAGGGAGAAPAPGQDPVDGERPGHPHHHLPRRGRARGGPLRGPGDGAPGLPGGPALPGRRGDVPHQRPVPGPGRGLRAEGACPTSCCQGHA